LAFTCASVKAQIPQEQASVYSYHPAGSVAAGQLATVDGPRIDVVDVSLYDYNANGYLDQITNPLGHRQRFLEYNDRGLPSKIVDENGIETLLSYHSKGWLRSSTRTLSTGSLTTTYQYDNIGQVTKITNPGNQTLSFEYDDARRLKVVINDQGDRIEYDYDAANNLTEHRIVSASGSITFSQRQTYDELNRLLSTLKADGSMQMSYRYDVNANPDRQIDGQGNETVFAYDALNRLTRQIDPERQSVQRQYDLHNQIVSATDQRGLTTTYTRSPLGFITHQTSPDTGETRFDYDAAGNLTKKTDAKGVEVSYTYDALNRLQNISYPDSTFNVTYGYDNTSDNNKGIGRLTSIRDGSGQQTHTYNEAGDITQTNYTYDNRTYTVSYSYDSFGRLSQTNFSNGRSIHYTYNDLGQIHGMTTSKNGQAIALASDVTYLPFGPMTQMRTLGNMLVQHEYDMNYRLSGLTVGNDKMTLLDRGYDYDANGNIESIINRSDDYSTQSFLYDTLNRLKQANGSYGDVQFNYDPVGNRTAKRTVSVNETLSYATDSNRLLTQGRTTYEYDHNGNIRKKVNGEISTEFHYGPDNRLGEVTVNGETVATYRYNGLGQRVIKQTPSQKTYYIYTTTGQLSAEIDPETGELMRQYVYLHGAPIAYIDKIGSTEEVFGIHNDHLGTPILLTNNNREIVWKNEPTPFGLARNIRFNLRFPGQYYDLETNLHYNYFRNYDPSTGRYLQSDPVGLVGGMNTYGYAYQNPLIHTDPLGLWVPQLIGAAVNLSFEGYQQYQSGQIDGGRLFMAAATGALGGFGSTAAKAIFFGAAAGATNAAYQEAAGGNTDCIDSSKVIRSAALGGAGGLVGQRIGKLGQNIYKAPNTTVFDPSVKVSVNYGTHGSAVGAALGGIVGNQ
jgi:RHS repeat-associated protein